jgi:predicted exporter
MLPRSPRKDQQQPLGDKIAVLVSSRYARLSVFMVATLYLLLGIFHIRESDDYVSLRQNPDSAKRAEKVIRPPIITEPLAQEEREER